MFEITRNIRKKTAFISASAKDIVKEGGYTTKNFPSSFGVKGLKNKV
jgi:hypothetical protein